MACTDIDTRGELAVLREAGIDEAQAQTIAHRVGEGANANRCQSGGEYRVELGELRQDFHRTPWTAEVGVVGIDAFLHEGLCGQVLYALGHRLAKSPYRADRQGAAGGSGIEPYYAPSDRVATPAART